MKLLTTEERIHDLLTQRGEMTELEIRAALKISHGTFFAAKKKLAQIDGIEQGTKRGKTVYRALPIDGAEMAAGGEKEAQRGKSAGAAKKAEEGAKAAKEGGAAKGGFDAPPAEDLTLDDVPEPEHQTGDYDDYDDWVNDLVRANGDVEIDFDGDRTYTVTYVDCGRVSHDYKRQSSSGFCIVD